MTIQLLAAHRDKSCHPSLRGNPYGLCGWLCLEGKVAKLGWASTPAKFGSCVAICPAPKPGCFCSDLFHLVLLSVLLDVMGPFCIGRCLSLGRMTALWGLGTACPCWVTQQCPTKHSWVDAEPKGTLDCFPLRLRNPQQQDVSVALGGVMSQVLGFLNAERTVRITGHTGSNTDQSLSPLSPPLPTFVHKSNRKRESLNFLNCFTHPQLEFQSEMKMPLKSTLHGSLREQVFLCCRV